MPVQHPRNPKSPKILFAVGPETIHMSPGTRRRLAHIWPTRAVAAGSIRKEEQHRLGGQNLVIALGYVRIIPYVLYVANKIDVFFPTPSHLLV